MSTVNIDWTLDDPLADLSEEELTAVIQDVIDAVEELALGLKNVELQAAADQDQGIEEGFSEG